MANIYMALGQSQLEGAQTSTGGWVFIAAVWTAIAVVWLATSRISGALFRVKGTHSRYVFEAQPTEKQGE